MVLKSKFLLRTINWNIERDHVTHNRDLERAMLEEELLEFKIAYQKYKTNSISLDEALVDMLDAICDAMFVYIGSMYKSLEVSSSYQKYEYKIDDAVTIFSAILLDSEYEDRVLEPGFINNLINLAYEKVLEANELKGTSKDKNGKITKGADWKDPKKEIANILKELKNNKEQE